MRPRKGFTLIEILVVITIIGILATLGIPAIFGAIETARKTDCAARLSQIMKAVLAYESRHKKFPPGRVGCDCEKEGVCKSVTVVQRSGTSGFALMLPDLDEGLLYDQFAKFKKGAVYPGNAAYPPKTDPNDPDSGKNADCIDATVSGWRTAEITRAIALRPAVFRCPTDVRADTISLQGISAGISSYAFCMGSLGPGAYSKPEGKNQGPITVKYNNNGAFMYRKSISARDVRDGMARTIFVGEAANGNNGNYINRWCTAWRFTDSLRSTENMLNAGGNIVRNDKGLQADTYTNYGTFTSRHRDAGANFAFGDGRVTFLLNTIDGNLYRALSTIARAMSGDYSPGSAQDLAERANAPD